MYWSVYIGVIYLATIVSIVRWGILSRADRMIVLVLVLSAIQQSIPVFSTASREEVALMYNINALAEFLLISLYFNYSQPTFRKRNTGIIIGSVGVVLGIVNMLFIQRFDVVNTYFLLAEAIAIVVFCMAAFLQMPLSETHRPTRASDFWITVLLLCYASGSLIGWLFMAIAGDGGESLFQQVFLRLLVVFNLAFFIGAGLVFFNYKKLHHSSEGDWRKQRRH
jgi:hypothetical protein